MSEMCVPSVVFSVSLFVTLLLGFPSLTSSFDIARVLSKNSSFSTFSNYISQTQLATQINNRRTITVLAVDNGAMSSISGKSMDAIRKVLSIHVILDYYDVKRLQRLNNKAIQVTTLYQASGQANNQEGFLKITDKENGVVSFASSSQQSSDAATLVGSVASEPFNLSVIQVSNLIIPSNLTSTAAHSKHSPSPSTSPVASPESMPSPVDAPTANSPNAPSADDSTDNDSANSGAPTKIVGFNGAFLILVTTFMYALHTLRC